MRKVSLASDDPTGSINKRILFCTSILDAYNLKLGFARNSSSQTSRSMAQTMAVISLKTLPMLLSLRNKQMLMTHSLLDAEMVIVGDCKL
jgi:hypothetical protein